MKSRINYPLKRVGERGENKWERISWDQAFEEIAEKTRDLMDEHGPHCISVNTGTAHHSDNNWVPWRFHAAIGSVNRTGHEQICYGAQIVTMEHSFGWPVSLYPPPGVIPKCMILIGNAHEAMPHIFAGVSQLVEAGTELIVLDPNLTETAKKADIWIQERPGSDIAIYLAWIRTIMKEEWYDKEFVEDWTNAPFLVRTDTKKILSGMDLKKGAGEDTFAVWNKKTNAPAIWDADARKFEEADVEKTLSGTYTVTLADGKKVECKTAWDMLADEVEDWTLEKASELSWVPARKLLAAVEKYAKNTPGFFVVAGHCYDSYAPGSSAVLRCRDILRMLTGSLDRTEMCTGMYDNDKCTTIYEMELKPDEFFSEEDKKKQVGADRFRGIGFDGFDIKAKYQKKQWGESSVSCAMWSCQVHHPTAWREILETPDKPDRIRALIMSGSNPLVKYSNAKLVGEVMRKLDLVVALEFVMTPSAQLSDYVLPMSDWFERPELGPTLPADMFNMLHVGQAVVKPQFERKNDYDVFRGLAIKLGKGDFFPWETLEDCYNERIKGLLQESDCKDLNEFAQTIGFDLPESKWENYKDMNGFSTPTGKAELWSVMLERLGYEPLPRYYEPAFSHLSTPELAVEYPMILIGIDRHLPNYHSMYFEVPSLRKMCPEPFVQIHPDTARRMSPPITDGDWVWVETPVGRMKQRAKLTFGIDQKVVKAQHHWWFPEQPGEDPYLHGVWQSNVNVVTYDDPDLSDPVFGSYPLTSLLCKVYKVTEGAHLEEGKPMY
jgi:anaerobic selenocysteine-containing dehydrogenase